MALEIQNGNCGFCGCFNELVDISERFQGGMKVCKDSDRCSRRIRQDLIDGRARISRCEPGAFLAWIVRHEIDGKEKFFFGHREAVHSSQHHGMKSDLPGVLANAPKSIKIPDPKFGDYESIESKAERYNSGCPETSKWGIVSARRFVVKWDGVICEWEYEVRFPVGIIYHDDVPRHLGYEYLEVSEEQLLEGLTHSHICNHKTAEQVTEELDKAWNDESSQA